MSPRRKATRRDLPGLCLLYAVIFALAAFALPFGAKVDMAKRTELYAIEGTVQSVSRTDLPKAGPKLHIFVWDGNRLHHLTQDDLFYQVSALRTLRVGDHVTALVRRDFFGRDLEWVWQVRDDGVTIPSYDQTQRFLEGEKPRMQVIGRWAGALSIPLFAVGFILRLHFGAWRDNTSRGGEMPATSARSS